MNDDDPLLDLRLEPSPRRPDGAIRQGHHRRTGAPVVVKDAAADPHVDAAADLLLAADHPGVLPVLDHVRSRALVLPWLPATLADLLAGERALGPEAVAQLVLALTDALHHLHRRGLVHGDLSPGNVLLHQDGQPVLADPAPPAGATAAYVAPELATGGPPTPAADVHALGVLGLELLGTSGPSDLRAALQLAAHPDPATRPSAADLARAVVEAVPSTSWLDRAAPAAASGEVPPLGATRTFGPRPPVRRPDPEPEPRARRRILRQGTLALLVTAGAACLVVAAAGREGSGVRCEHAADAPPGAVAGDLDGDGCDEVVGWDREQAVLTLAGGRRLQLGQPGDHLLLGDWDCDDVDTPAVYRPSTGEVFEFAAWLEGEGALASTEAHQTGVHDGVPTVTEPTGAGCDHVTVERPAAPTPAG